MSNKKQPEDEAKVATREDIKNVYAEGLEMGKKLAKDDRELLEVFDDLRGQISQLLQNYHKLELENELLKAKLEKRDKEKDQDKGQGPH